MLGTFEQMENTWSTTEPMKKNLVGTFDEYGADGQGEEGGVSDNKAANISHLSHIFLHCVAVFFSSSKSTCEQ